MIRAIFFDFYGVWTPDKFAQLMTQAEQQGTESAVSMYKTLDEYFSGRGDLNMLVNSLKFNHNMVNISSSDFELREENISMALIDFFRGLHSHFVKIGVFANLGTQELEILKSINAKYSLFEVITGPITIGEQLLTKKAFVQALTLIGEPPESTLVISSNPEYLKLAQSFGIHVLPFQGFPNLMQSLVPLLTSA